MPTKGKFASLVANGLNGLRFGSIIYTELWNVIHIGMKTYENWQEQRRNPIHSLRISSAALYQGAHAE
jgi:hypothetical protein